jgi:hypothetical protein
MADENKPRRILMTTKCATVDGCYDIVREKFISYDAVGESIPKFIWPTHCC